MNLKRKIILPLILILFLIIILGMTSTRMVQNKLGHLIGSHSAIIAEEFLNSLNRFLSYKATDLEAFTQSADIIDLLQSSNNEFEQYGNIDQIISTREKEWAKTNNSFLQNQLMNNTLANHLKHQVVRSEAYQNLYGTPLFTEAFITNQYGATIAMTNRTSDYFQADEDWWKKAKENDLFIDDIQFDDSSNAYAISMSIRIDDNEGNFLGVLKSEIPVDFLINLIQNLHSSIANHQYDHIGYTHNPDNIILLTKYGNVIYDSNGSLFLSDFTKSPAFTPDLLKSDWGYWSHQEKATNQFYVFSKSFLKNTPVNLNWILLMEFNAKNVFSPVTNLKEQFILVIVISIFFTLGLGFMLNTFLIEPLGKLKQDVIRIGKGDLSTQININSDDEIGALAKSFNQMTSILKETTVSKQDLLNINNELTRRERALKNILFDLHKTHEELKNAQSQLLQSEKMASLGQLSAGVAHEINNPLGFISSNIESLEKYLESYSKLFRGTNNLKKAIDEGNLQKAKDLNLELSRIEKKMNLNFIASDSDNLIRETKGGIERIKKIILDLKTFSRKNDEQMEQHQLQNIIESILSIVWNEIKYKAEIKKDYAQLDDVHCNEQKLGQVFINLLINACQAIENKGEILIRTYQENSFACVDIQDNGCGIEEDTLQKIFDPFYTTKKAGEGTGLGLSVSYDIIRQHNGTLSATSKLGEGATFTVKIPFQQPKREQQTDKGETV